ncbi:hypothetical protein E2562_002864 [Oryza meyeriana var. granulata]|uniref:Uncharacterized protein n=1 Tax=Oryza meyeriana var. granulata TaxID=110450 RepID=A0A6G1BRZ8_9ORYZ|nr:hypothetical protein E2562_002864 [Oryza meyeriana var. granulata]
MGNCGGDGRATLKNSNFRFGENVVEASSQIAGPRRIPGPSLHPSVRLSDVDGCDASGVWAQPSLSFPMGRAHFNLWTVHGVALAHGSWRQAC